MIEYTGIPLTINFGEASAIEMELGEIEESIGNLLELIVFTPKGSFNADPEFGFEYWNHEFSNINIREFNNSYIGMVSNIQTLNDISRKQCENSLRESILAYEPRLLKPEVRIEMEVNNRILKKSSQSKYEMRIFITGAIDGGLGITHQYEKRISFMVEPIAKKISI